MKTSKFIHLLIVTLGVAVSVGNEAEAADGAAVRADYREIRKIAKDGDTEAQWEVARRLEKGIGVRADLKRAIRWYSKSAAKGHVRAQYRMGKLCGEGEGVKRCEKVTLTWYRKAAAQGHRGAMNRIGVHYVNGWGVSPDLAEAQKWFTRASESGDISAVANMKATGRLLLSDLTRVEVAQAH